MTLIPGVASARAPDICEIGKTCDMQVLVLGRHWRSGRGRTAGDRSGTDGRRGMSRHRRIFWVLRLRNAIFLKEIPAVHVHKDSGAREVAKHHYWYKYRSQLFLEGFRGRRKYRHVRKELTHSICMILSGKMVYTLLI